MNAKVETLLREFRDPSGDYAPLLMWFWNDVITEEQITFQMEQFRKQNITNFFVHPACGFDIEYLSDRYMELIQYVVKEAKRLGMYYWIYDEYEFPSGTAGGILCRDYPQYRKKHLRVEDCTLYMPGDRVDLTSHGDFVGAQLIMEKHGRTYVRDISGECVLTRDGGTTHLTWFYDECSIVMGRALFYFSEVDLLVRSSGANRLGAGRIQGYVDMLNREAVGKFIQLTHERYKQYIGEEFGKTVRGIFTDEPTPNIMYFYDTIGIWNDDFPAEFEKDHGYSILPWLYTLWGFEAKTPEEIHAQSDYRSTVKRLYFDSFVKQIGSWCGENNLIFTGHFGGEENLMNQLAQGDMLEELMYFGMPGCDSILSADRIDTEEFNIAGKLAASAAKFSGKERVLCETYTGSGWRLRFPMMKRIANRLLIMGVNWIQYMGGFYSTGAAAKNFPFGFAPSHNYQNTLFAHYHDLNKYIAGFQALSANTRPDSRVLLMIPLQQTIHDRHHWINGKWSEADAFASFYERFFIDTVNALLYEGVAYDLFSENLVDRITVHDGYAEVFGCRYDALVFPRMHHVNTKTRALIAALKAHGVRMVFSYELPGVDTGTGETFDPGFNMDLYDSASCVYRDGNAFLITRDFPGDLNVYRSAFRAVIGERILNIEAENGVYICKRSNEDAEVYLLCNDGQKEARVVIDALPGMQVLSAESDAPAVYTVKGGRIHLTLAGYQMVAIVRDRQGTALPETPAVPAWEQTVAVLEAPYTFTAADGNYLPLQYEMFDEETGRWDPCRFMYFSDYVHLRQNAPFWLRSQVQIGYLPKTVWLNAEVQRITRLAVNGTELPFCSNIKRWSPEDYTADVTALLHEGDNLIEIEGNTGDFAKFSRPPYVYLSGAFGVDAVDRMVCPAAEILPTGWEKTGYPYYCGEGIYKTIVTVESGWEKAALTIPTEDIAVVCVNGASVGKKLWLANEVDVTEYLHPGENEIEVRITSTRANMFGCRADNFGESEFYGHYAAERTENGLLAPMTLCLYRRKER